MRNQIKKEIKRLCKRAFDKAVSENETIEKYQEKFERRTRLPPGTSTVHVRNYVNRQFDPWHCKRHANGISKAIWQKILAGNYEPKPALVRYIPKKDGSKREIMCFSIPDAAVANVLLRTARDRNKKKLSPHSYAYHPDKNLFDAVLAVNDYKVDGKLFAVQVDFEKYFDNISSTYIKKKLSDKFILSLTPHERKIFESFLHHKYADDEGYRDNTFSRRVRGTPQGSSASLLLANLANHDLDRKIAAEAGVFARFADDVVAVCDSYENALKIEKCFYSHCRDSGLKVNQSKSPGIAILSDYNGEIRTVRDFTYLGYKFGINGLSIPDSSINRIKSKISRLINIYLLTYLKYGFNNSRSSYTARFDWDLLGLVYEIRRSLYGGLREEDIRLYLEEGVAPKNLKGLMSFYCLIEDPAVLKELDGWIVNMVRRACVVRNRVLHGRYIASCPTPSNSEIITGSWLDPSMWDDDADVSELEVKFPSLVRGWRAARKYYFTYGLEKVSPPGYQSSSDISLLFDVGY